jgi:H+/Na+-translocating ferredoxin:NAD+ oxidoreductase subunit B
MNPVYPQLARHLDDLPGGYPATESGVELRILQRLFTPQDAALALKLTVIPEPPRVVARRAGLIEAAAAERLEAMASKGLIFRVTDKNGRADYMAAQFVVGIWEFQVNRLTPELIEDMEAYIPTLMRTAWKRPQLRTIPVNRSIRTELPVMTHERAEALLSRHRTFAVSPCICRRERTMVGQGCDRPQETCLSFGTAAEYMVANHIGRFIDASEALAILHLADKKSLVVQPGHARAANYICLCCGCCCGVLRTLKTYPRPADMVASAFSAHADPSACSGCGVCPERCQMDALSLMDDRVVLDTGRCIGCGLCVTTCPTGALTLKRKPADQQPRIPHNAVTAALAHGRARGKLGMGELIHLQIDSALDRLRTRKQSGGTATPKAVTDYYGEHYQYYHDETVAIDPEPFLGAFARRLSRGDRVLDVGCGSGRDLRWLQHKGMAVTGFERSPGLAKLAAHHAGCDIIEGDFHTYDFKSLAMDALLMSGALVHVPHDLLKDTLANILGALNRMSNKRIVYLSLKEGTGAAADSRGRMFYFWQPSELTSLLANCGLQVLEFNRSAAADGSGQIWLGFVLYHCGV